MTATREIPVSTPPCRYPFYNDLGREGDYYYNARWYDAETGRFITEDPIRDGLNWYVYTSNNPIKYIDPTGMIFGLSSEESGEYDSDSNRPIEKDDDDDGGSEPPKKDEPEKKSLWGRYLDYAKKAYKNNKMRELMEKIPKEVREQLEQNGITPDMLFDFMSGDFSNYIDYSGIIYFGAGASAYLVGGVSHEGGKALMFENGKIIDSKLYNSESIGWLFDAGSNGYGVVGALPDAGWNDFFGVGGSQSFGRTFIRTAYGDIGFAGGWTTPREGIYGLELYITYGNSVLPQDINAGSVTYSQEVKSSASTFYIPPKEEW